jgi:KaiC/GvpD/RAD55 family RecA-like ATPase
VNHDIEIEDQALNRALLRGEAPDVFRIAPPHMFTPGPRQDLAFLLQRFQDRSGLATAAMEEAQRTGSVSIIRLIPEVVACEAVSSGPYYAGFVATAHARREIIAIGARLQQRAQQVAGEELPELQQAAADALLAVQTPNAVIEDDAYDMDYFLALERGPDAFTFPGMLTRDERFLMVGKEGGGKSTLVYQMLTGAAYGYDTLTGKRYEPQRVVFLDVENNPYQIADQIRLVHGLLNEYAPDVKPYWKNLKRRVVDLTDKAQQASVIRSITAHQPDVLYLGTAYKLAFSEDYRVMARAIMTTVDRVRAEVGCTTFIEHHAGWGDKNDRNGWRPDGTSEWARWADFARGMDVRWDERAGLRVMKLVESSRMDRSAGRAWPGGFEQRRSAADFPWVPLEPEHFEQKYGSLYEEKKQRV